METGGPLTDRKLTGLVVSGHCHDNLFLLFLLLLLTGGEEGSEGGFFGPSLRWQLRLGGRGSVCEEGQLVIGQLEHVQTLARPVVGWWEGLDGVV